MDVDPRLLAFYSQGTDERDRLSVGRGRLELARMQELLQRVLPPPPARVADVGGGPGTYAAWLARDGFDVTVVDVVPALVDQALAASRAQPRHPFAAVVGDARRLPLADASVDAVLLLGPLYHLQERTDRMTALSEARRVLAPGGALAAAAISRYAALLDVMRVGMLDDPAVARLVAGVLRNGCLDGGDHFTTAYCHRPGELLEDVAEAGFVRPAVLPVQGPGWLLWRAPRREGTPAAQGEDDADDELLASAVRCARVIEDVPELLGASAHLLAVAVTAPSTS